ncbi:hypothetical protein SLE2022_319160 [Rubroshorea leprosula]
MESKTVSSELLPPVLVAATVESLPILHTNTGPAVADLEKTTAFVGLLLLLLLLLLLNLEPGFDGAAEDDDEDDSFGDPDSSPFAFPVPAFNGEHFFLLMGCWLFTLSLLPDFLFLTVLLPPH